MDLRMYSVERQPTSLAVVSTEGQAEDRICRPPRRSNHQRPRCRTRTERHHPPGREFSGVVPQSASGQARQRRRHHQSGTGRRSLSVSPLLVFASSAAVYGSRNPYRYPERITAQTPVNPIDQYGEDKVLAEAVIQGSALPYALLRLGGVVAPDGAANLDSDYLLLMRATPGDTRLHTVDARDVALAFANAVDRGDTIDGEARCLSPATRHTCTCTATSKTTYSKRSASGASAQKQACQATPRTTVGGPSPDGSPTVGLLTRRQVPDPRS